nr:PREDICTED: biorientation of chromosomes in cell division protein 1-like 1 isoform X2 [Anolis carolinensis]|eukprot:XP_008117289.1 PREDICTED: biorientation of chromosomes in cell division protein 1-like 1 isoform X2 [Anolis carolinensis]
MSKLCHIFECQRWKTSQGILHVLFQPAYQNLRQRVDNFVSNHLATHTWSPHLNKNQLRNNIRQQVLKSGMLESGIDRIISQVVDPKINHIFRPQVEKAVHEFLATLNHKEETSPSIAPPEEKPDVSVLMQGVSSTIPSASVANDAMSILETITSLNQEANAARASTEAANVKTNDRISKRVLSQLSVDGTTEKDRNTDVLLDEEKPPYNSMEESFESVANSEDVTNLFSSSEEGKTVSKDMINVVNPVKEIVQESEEQKSKPIDKYDKKPEHIEKGEKRKEKKEKPEKKLDLSKKAGDDLKGKEEKTEKDKETELLKCLVLEKSSSKHKGNGSTKEALEDSDIDVLSDITVSSVHTSDLSSFEEESEDEVALSDSTEEGEIVSDDEEKEQNQVKTQSEAGMSDDKKLKSGRHAYVHKPYLYSKYYSDSDDERTVEQRRLSVAKEKEERLLKRHLNREKLEEKRKQKAAEKTKMLKTGNQVKSIQNLEESSSKGLEQKASGASIKDALKEQRFLEKKAALSRKRKRESRHDEEGRKKKHEQPEEDLEEPLKINESGEKAKEVKASQGKTEGNKLVKKLPESVHITDENRSDSKIEKEHKRKTSSSFQMEGIQQDGELCDTKSQIDKAENNPEESQKQRTVFKTEKHIKKDDSETQNVKTVPKKEARSSKDRNEKERSISEDKSLIKHKYKGDGVHKTAEEVECLPSQRGLKSEENFQKYNQLLRTLSDDKAERKNKHRSERKTSVSSKDVKTVSDHTSRNEENTRKESNRKDRPASTDKLRTEHKSKRLLSDSRPPKESQSISKQHSSATSRKSESSSEDKHDADSSNLDNNLKQSDSIQKDRRKSKSASEERLSLKSKSKSHSKVIKVPENESQNSSSKQESVQKLDKDKNTEENDIDKQGKSRSEIKVFEENSIELELESEAHSVSSSQKDFSHRFKSAEKSSVKEKTKSDKDLGSARLEKKLSAEGHKSRSVRHVSKETKKREDDNKPVDKSVKQTENYTKMQENSPYTDKRLTKRISSENRKGSVSSQEIDVRGEKLVTSVAVPIPALQKTECTSGHSLHSEQSQEQVEVESEQRHGNAHHHIEGERSHNSQQATKCKISAKDQVHHNSTNEFTETLHTKELSKSSLSGVVNPKQKELFSTKEISTQNDTFKQSSKNVGSSKQKQCRAIVENETSDKVLLHSSPKENAKLQFQTITEDVHTSKNVKNTITLSEESSPPTNISSREDVIHQKSMDKDLGEVMVPLSCTSKEKSFNFDGPCMKNTISDHQIPMVKTEQKNIIELSSNIKYGDNTNMDVISADGKSHLSCPEAPEENVSSLSGIQEAVVQERTKSSLADTIKNESFCGPAIQVTHVSVDNFAITILEEGKDSSGPSAKNNEDAIEGKIETKESNNAYDITELSSRSIPENVPEDINKVSAIVNEAEGKGGDTRPQSDNSVVGSSVGGSNCVSTCSGMEIDALVIGTSTERTVGSAVTASSTEGELRKEGVSNLQRERDATITCSEENSKTTLSCTSIEADEGFIVGTWTKNKEGVHFEREKCFGECTVTAAEESGSITEGLSVCESSSTTTKEGESAECIVNYAEEGTKQFFNQSGIERDQSMNSFTVEEKDDAVTSAGSEERCMASVSGGTSTFGSVVICTGELESDGAVTSAGTEAQNGSMITGNQDECQNNATGTEQVKGAEGAVTCTGTVGANVFSAICSVTGTDSQEEGVVTGVFAESDNHVATGPHADKSEDIINGESAVTSTGITREDDPEAAPACAGLEDSNEGFAAASDTEEKYNNATFSTEDRTEENVLEFTQSSYDDERCVTSTGAKEEDEEGENFVTSTGRDNEETENTLACTGTDESERVLVCVEATASVSQAVSQAGERLDELNSNTDKDAVGSMMDLEKEMTTGDISNSTKGVVESSTTSTDPGNQHIMSAVVRKEGSLLAEKFKCDMISATSNTQSIDELSAGEGKSESTTSYLDGEECESLFKVISKKVTIPQASANQDDKDEGETISTSVVKVCPNPIHCSTEEHSEQKSAHEVANRDETTCLIDAEDFSVPMPSTSVECMRPGPAVESSKGPTSILEDFEAPMPSLTVEDDKSLFAAVKSEMTTSLGVNAVSNPIVSAGRSSESYIVEGKEERDECSVISTSIIDETEMPISQEDTESDAQRVALRVEQSTDTTVISTSSTENVETSVFSTETDAVNQVPSTDRKLETSTITTTEGCHQATRDNLVPIEAKERNGDTMGETEECKAVQEVGSQKSDLLVQSTEKINQNDTDLTQERTDYEAHQLIIDNTKPDQRLATLSIENPGNSTKISVRTMTECDSVSTIGASEESTPVASEKTPLSFASIEVEDEKKIAVVASESDCNMLPAPENNEISSAVIHRDSQKLQKGETDGALEESAPSKNSNTEDIEIPSNTVKSVIGGTDLYLNSLVSDGSSMEATKQENGTQDSRQHTEDSSSPSGIPQEKEKGNENLETDDVNLNTELKTGLPETRDSPNKESSMTLLQNSEDRKVLDSKTNLCSQYGLASKNVKVEEHHNPEAFSHGSKVDNNGNKEMLAVTAEELEENTKLRADEGMRNTVLEHLCAKDHPEDILKEHDCSDILVVTEAVEDKGPKENSLQLEISNQKEEYSIPESAKSPAAGNSESDHDPVCQTLEETDEQTTDVETKPKINMEATIIDSEEKLEAGANSQEPSLESVNEKDEKAVKVDSFGKTDLESKTNSTEVNPPVKRKRGRPRKHPIEIKVVEGQELEADTSPGNTMKTSGPNSKQKTTPKGKDSLTENQRQSETEEEKTEVVLSRRGRKPKRPLIPSEETGMDSPEPDRKRLKLAPAVQEETKDHDGRKESSGVGRNDNGDNSGSDADEMHSGATTRAASRLEAQRKQPSKPTTRAAAKNQSPDPVPPRKRKRVVDKKESSATAKSNKSPISAHSKLQSPRHKKEVRPLMSHKKSHPRANEPEAKKSKR